jgi:hypothetical protein
MVSASASGALIRAGLRECVGPGRACARAAPLGERGHSRGVSHGNSWRLYRAHSVCVVNHELWPGGVATSNSIPGVNRAGKTATAAQGIDAAAEFIGRGPGSASAPLPSGVGKEQRLTAPVLDAADPQPKYPGSAAAGDRRLLPGAPQGSRNCRSSRRGSSGWSGRPAKSSSLTSERRALLSAPSGPRAGPACTAPVRWCPRRAMHVRDARSWTPACRTCSGECLSVRPDGVGEQGDLIAGGERRRTGGDGGGSDRVRVVVVARPR